MIVSVDIPQELFERASAIAREQKLSVSDVLAEACEEHVEAWERLQQRAQRGNRSAFLEVLAKVPDVAPEAADRFDSK